MSYGKIFVAALTLCAVLSSCSQDKNTESSESVADSKVSQETTVQENTEEVSEETPEEEPATLVPPVPAEASDPNAVTFDDGNFSFATPQLNDKDSAQGTLEITEVQGNKMLCFKDDNTAPLEEKVQKIQFDAMKMLSPENAAKVRSIEFDAYADATSDKFVNDDGENVKAAGWIGGGGGANVSGDKWYNFSEWEGGEYNFEMSGAIHVTFKFLLAAGGQCWDETMPEATFMIMRWGAKNEGNFYVDNIVFYDGDGNSLPIEVSEGMRDDSAEYSDDSDSPDVAVENPDINIDDLLADAESQLSEYESQVDDAIQEVTELISEMQN